MSFLLDTNVLSEVRKRERAHAGVMRWFASAPERDLYISTLVLGEVRYGVEQARGRDAVKAGTLERWLAAITARFSSRLIPVDDVIAEEWGRLASKRTLAPVDGLMAATARVRELTFVTRDHEQLHGLGVRVLDPFR
jgi:predicted nucleic acid-binding protein